MNISFGSGVRSYRFLRSGCAVFLFHYPKKVTSRTVIIGGGSPFCKSMGFCQSGSFRSGRSTMDMIFTLRMILETAKHKKVPMYLLFIDLIKAYDSVSRQGLWAVLKSKGVPGSLLTLIKQYYSKKVRQVSTEGVLSAEFSLSTGLGQGCCLAPLLFNIYFGAVMESWVQLAGPRTSWFTRVDGVLRRQSALYKYAIHRPWSFQEMGYADDLALITDTLDRLRSMHARFDSHLKHWGLSLSATKTEALATLVNHLGPLEDPPTTEQGVQFTRKFKYLGSYIDSDLTCDEDILHRLDQARKAFWRLASTVWDVNQLTLGTKIAVYRACVLSVLLYGSETWTVGWLMKRKLKVFHMMCLRKISGVTRWAQQRDGLPNDHVMKFLGVPTIEELLHQNRLRWMGHVARMDNSRMPKQALFSFLPPEMGVHRLPGKQSGKRLRDAMVNSLEVIQVPLQGWVQMALLNDGKDWKLQTRAVACWYSPFPPRGGQPLPDRAAEFESICQKPLRQHRKGWEWELKTAQDYLQPIFNLPEGFLAWENQMGAEGTVWNILAQVAEEVAGEDWLYLEPDYLTATVLEHKPDWDTWFTHLRDIKLLAFCLDTTQRIAIRAATPAVGLSPLPAKPPRRRLGSKQPRLPAFFTSTATSSTDIPDNRPVEKYWAIRKASSGEGVFECPLPECGRLFPTKTGLSKHLMLTHREGSYRDRTWNCPHCPRSFDLEAGLTKHLPLHTAAARPCVCCVCDAFFPGKDSARMHMNHAHSASTNSLPITCPHCPASEAPVFHQHHAFSLHRLRCHVYSSRA